MRNEDMKGAGREFAGKQVGGILFEPYTLAATGSLTFREVNMLANHLFCSSKLFWCDDSTLPSETLFTGSLQNRFSIISLEGSNSVEEDTFETSPWICTWLLLLELRGSQGSQKICLRRGLGMQLCL